MNAESESADTRAEVVTLARKIGFDSLPASRGPKRREHATEFRDWLDRGDAG